MELLADAQAGDQQALESLISRYQDRIRRIVRIQLNSSVIRRDFDSMDIVQNTFQVALPRLGEFHPKSAGSLLHWLSAISTNQILDAYSKMRAAKRDVGRRINIGNATPSQDAEFLEMAQTGGVEEDAQYSEVKELLDEAVAKLPEDQRRVVILRDYCGQEWKEIADQLQRETGAARQLHQRAWIKLRRSLRPLIEAWRK